MSPIGIYCNYKAGKGKHTKKILKDITSQLSQPFCIIPNNNTKAWLAKNPIKTFIVLSGDGTINFLISCLKDSAGITIIPVALGTANIIYHSGATNLRLASAQTSHNKPCLFAASFGFDAAVVARVSQKRKGNINRLSYLLAGIKTLFTFKNHKQAVTVDGKELGTFDFGIIAQTSIYGSPRFCLTVPINL